MSSVSPVATSAISPPPSASAKAAMNACWEHPELQSHLAHVQSYQPTQHSFSRLICNALVVALGWMVMDVWQIGRNELKYFDMELHVYLLGGICLIMAICAWNALVEARKFIFPAPPPKPLRQQEWSERNGSDTDYATSTPNATNRTMTRLTPGSSLKATANTTTPRSPFKVPGQDEATGALFSPPRMLKGMGVVRSPAGKALTSPRHHISTASNAAPSSSVTRQIFASPYRGREMTGGSRSPMTSPAGQGIQPKSPITTGLASMNGAPSTPTPVATSYGHIPVRKSPSAVTEQAIGGIRDTKSLQRFLHHEAERQRRQSMVDLGRPIPEVGVFAGSPSPNGVTAGSRLAATGAIRSPAASVSAGLLFSGGSARDRFSTSKPPSSPFPTAGGGGAASVGAMTTPRVGAGGLVGAPIRRPASANSGGPVTNTPSPKHQWHPGPVGGQIAPQSFQTYRAASRQTSAPTFYRDTAQRHSNRLLLYRTPEETLQELLLKHGFASRSEVKAAVSPGMDEQERWLAAVLDTEMLRRWLSKTLLEPLREQIELVDAAFQEQGWHHLTCRKVKAKAKNATATGTVTAATATTPAVAMGSIPATLDELALRHGQSQAVQVRLKLERYLHPTTLQPGTTPPHGYIAERICDLGHGAVLSKYRWDGHGEQRRSHASDTEQAARVPLPTDAEIIMHLFCSFLDESMPDENRALHGDRPFTNMHYVSAEGKLCHGRDSFQIRQVQRQPPHYQLVVNNTVYDVFEGRNNLFHTLILFVDYIQREYAGYIGVCDLGGKAIDLLSILKT